MSKLVNYFDDVEIFYGDDGEYDDCCYVEYASFNIDDNFEFGRYHDVGFEVYVDSKTGNRGFCIPDAGYDSGSVFTANGQDIRDAIMSKIEELFDLDS